MEINAIDANGSGTHVKLDRWRRKMRMMSYVLLHYLQALIQPTDFDALLVNMDSILFTDSKTQVNQLCRFLLLYKILQVCSPSTCIDVESLETEFSNTTLESYGGDYTKFCTELTRLKDSINLEMDSDYCTERKLALQFFRGALIWMNDVGKLRSKASITSIFLTKSRTPKSQD